jgi:hypothetical protein
MEQLPIWGLDSPAALSIVRALAAHLEVKPLVEQVPLVERVVGQLFLLIVHLFQVLDDGSRLPERQIGVGVHDRCSSQSSIDDATSNRGLSRTRHSSVGIDVDERRLLDVVELKRLDDIGDSELLEYQDCL